MVLGESTRSRPTSHYNEVCTHLSMNKDAPSFRCLERSAPSWAAVAGWLLHIYVRVEFCSCTGNDAEPKVIFIDDNAGKRLGSTCSSAGGLTPGWVTRGDKQMLEWTQAGDGSWLTMLV